MDTAQVHTQDSHGMAITLVPVFLKAKLRRLRSSFVQSGANIHPDVLPA